jgi:hypothetical protein
MDVFATVVYIARMHPVSMVKGGLYGTKAFMLVPSKNVRGCKPSGFGMTSENLLLCATKAASSQLKCLHALDSPTENIVYNQYSCPPAVGAIFGFHWMVPLILSYSPDDGHRAAHDPTPFNPPKSKSPTFHMYASFGML